MIPVAEVFGPTIQGEGALAGVPTYFLRVGGCDFACAWCDSGYAVRAEDVRELPRREPGEIAEDLLERRRKGGPQWLTISGGNPALFDLSLIVRGWQWWREEGLDGKVAVETQGSRWQPWFSEVNLLTVSPKPPSSAMENGRLDAFMDYEGNAEDYAQHLELVDPGRYPRDWRKMVFKVVVFDEDDYEFARKLHIRWPLIPFYLSCGTASGGLDGKWSPAKTPSFDEGGEHYWISGESLRSFGFDQYGAPDGVDDKLSLLMRYRWLAEKAARDPVMADVAIFPQLHALTWGISTRGV